MAATSLTLDTVYTNLKQACKQALESIKPYLRIDSAMHATLILSALLTAGTAVLAFPSRGTGQRTFGTTTNPSHSSGWDTSFDDQCRHEGYFPSPYSCRQFYRCTAKSSSQSAELTKYQFECPADQIYCRSQIACVHPWACAEECHIPKDQRERVGKIDHLKPRGSGKQCPPFKCERPGTFTDPHECGR